MKTLDIHIDAGHAYRHGTHIQIWDRATDTGHRTDMGQMNTLSRHRTYIVDPKLTFKPVPCIFTK
jgi:hypothetical protein